MVSQIIRRAVDPNQKVQITYKQSGKGQYKAWRWAAYSWGTKVRVDRKTGREILEEGYVICRCISPAQGFPTYQEAVDDAQDLLNVPGE